MRRAACGIATASAAAPRPKAIRQRRGARPQADGSRGQAPESPAFVNIPLGYAVVDEVVQGLLLERWLTVLDESSADPLTALQQTLRRRAASLTAEEIELGCPLNNLAQEMSPLDEQFRPRIDATFGAWRDGFARALARGQWDDTVRRDVNARSIAAFVVAAAEGSYGLAKSVRSRAMLRSNLETLRPEPMVNG